MSEIYDLAILGAGPAGITAAIYALRGKMNILWIDEKFATGGQITDTSEIDNYPGMPGVTGMDLGEAMGEHARRIGAEPVREKVRSLENLDQEIRTIRTKKHEYQARAVILALGAAHRKLMIPGEEELSGMGVSYCATCDGAFYKDRVVAVTGGGDVALEDAAFLARLCKKVYIIHRRDVFRGTKVLQDQIFRCENVEVIWDSVAEEILGESEVTGLRIRNIKTEEKRDLDVDGVFVAVGMEPDTGIVKGMVKLDEAGYICAGEDCVTSIPGVFAAGDIRTKPLRQVVTAVADGACAASSAMKYLDGLG
nr:thioredoxin-disulfide reductase [uncultured Blautia sp.]